MTTLSKAEAAFQHARTVETPEAWKAAALALYAVRQPKAPKSRGKCRYPFPVAVATFADGTVIRRTFFSAAGKATDWNRAERIASRGYVYQRTLARVEAFRQSDGSLYDFAGKFSRMQRACVVPPLVSIVEEITGERVDYAEQREAA